MYVFLSTYFATNAVHVNVNKKHDLYPAIEIGVTVAWDCGAHAQLYVG